MEIVNRGEYTYFVPVADHECSSITSFFKWEQAFRNFSKVYMSRYPNKSAELIQYNHIIFTVSQTFIWENVYLYDKEFRLHISNYPQRSWSVILQQAWSMYLKDRIKYDYNGSNNKTGNQNQKAKRENCRRFNVGKCKLLEKVVVMIIGVMNVENGDMELIFVERNKMQAMEIRTKWLIMTMVMLQ